MKKPSKVIIMEIKINVVGTKFKDLNEFENFQGDLKEISKQNLERLKESIKRNGFNAPIFIWKGHNYILDGHQRIKAVKELIKEGYILKDNKLPYVEIEAKDKTQAGEMILSYNSQYGVITNKGLELFVSDFKLDIKDMKNFLDFKEFSIFKEKLDVIDDNFNVDKSFRKPKYKINYGDIYKLGKHRLMCGDATKKEDVEKLMNGKKVDLVLTDPPYNFENFSFFNNVLDYSTENAELFIFYSDKLGIKLAFKFFDYFIRTFIIKFQTGVLISNNQPMQAHDLIFHFRKNKNNFKNLYDGFSTYLGEINKNFIRQNEFRYEKSIEILSKIILHYTNNSNIVLDLFGGSGSTLIACEQLDRICYMMEIDPVYCSVIIERWEHLTGKKAKKIN